MNAWDVLVEATMKATSLIAQNKGVHDELVANSDRAYARMTEVLKKNTQRILEEWKGGTEAHMPEAWLRELMNVQANELGLEILKRMELIQ